MCVCVGGGGVGGPDPAGKSQDAIYWYGPHSRSNGTPRVPLLLEGGPSGGPRGPL